MKQCFLDGLDTHVTTNDLNKELKTAKNTQIQIHDI